MTRKNQVVARLSVSLLLSVAAACTAAAQDLPTRLDEYLKAQVNVNHFNGSVLVARDGKVILGKGYGMANFELGVPNSPSTKFRLGSITKQFTATAILLLQEDGKLSVQDPVCKHVAECPDAWKEVTIHHLLTHTSGIPNFTSFPDYQKTMTMPSPVDSTIARFKNKPLEFKPGEKMAYSNSGYILLGHIIEKVSGKSYEAFLRERIFEPLKMVNTGYDNTTALLSGRAAGYSRRGDTITNAAYLDMSIPHGAGALYSTVEDFLVWDQALSAGKLLSKKSLEMMFTPALNDYAYGWAVTKQFNHATVSHGGGINGFATFFARFPDDRLCIAVLTNLVPSPAPPGRISRDLAAIVFGESYDMPREKVAIKVDPAIFDAYEGKYELNPNLSITISREGDKLMGMATGQPKVQLLPESETKFFIPEVGADVTFVKDEKGSVTHLVLQQGGQESPAKKVQ